MYNNYNNDNFNNNPKPLFVNEFPSLNGTVNNENNYQNNFNVTNQDIPPVLEPIKNLRDASIVNAPTMEVLDPMNIMTETLERKEPQKQVDPLDAYDNGINYQNSTVPSQESNFMQSTEITSNFQNSPIENNMQPDSFNFAVQQENKFDNIPSNLMDNQNYEGVNTPIFNLNTQQQFEQYEPNLINDDNVSKESFEADSNNFIQEEKIEEQPSYEIVERPISIEAKDPMLDLGIDNTYDDIDMLDIVDVDEEGNKESEDTSLTEEPIMEQNNEEKPLLTENVNEIRELINKLKEKGIKIDFEEFDFEHMYQLIIKIEK